MLIVLETNQSWVSSEPINGVRYPLNIADLWSDEELASIGLARFVEPPTELHPDPPPEPLEEQ